MSSRRERKPLKLVNLELHHPSVPLALSMVADILRTARQEGFAAVKIIHGYGSSGVGGDIRSALQRTLAQHASDKQIRAFIAGEDWRISNEDAWTLVQKHWALKNDPDLNRANKGISIVVL